MNITTARLRLSIFNEKEIRLLCPQAGVPMGAEAQRLSEKFFAILSAIFLFHRGELVLIVRKNISPQGDLKTFLYLGKISSRAQVVLTLSGEVLIPTSRFVYSRDYMSVARCGDCFIPEEALGDKITTLYFRPARKSFALEFHIGMGEVGRWFYERQGSHPYLFSNLWRALNTPTCTGINEALQLQYA